MKSRSLVLAVVASLFPITLAVAKPRPPLPPLPEPVLQLWHFDATNWFAVEPAPPVEAVNVFTVESWSGYAPWLGGAQPATLRFPAVDTAGRATLSPAQGSVRFWFCPQWSSASLGGTGPGADARLIEVGAFTDDASLGWWALWLSADGDTLNFSAQAAGQTATFLSAPVQWRSNQWRQVVLTYSAERSLLFIDGQLAGAGAGCRFARISRCWRWVDLAWGAMATATTWPREPSMNWPRLPGL